MMHKIWVTVLLQKTAGAGDWKGAPLNPQMEGSQLSLQSTPDTLVLTVKESAFKVSCTEQTAVQQRSGEIHRLTWTTWQNAAVVLSNQQSRFTVNYVIRGIYLTAMASQKKNKQQNIIHSYTLDFPFCSPPYIFTCRCCPYRSYMTTSFHSTSDRYEWSCSWRDSHIHYWKLCQPYLDCTRKWFQ